MIRNIERSRLEALIAGWREDPLIRDIMARREVSWFNPAVRPVAEALGDVGLNRADIDAAAARLFRFAPYLAQVFPDTRASQGIIESPLHAAGAMQQALAQRYGMPLAGRLWLKLDSHLPVSGSIKARGGIHEVLQHAETLALGAGLITPEGDYTRLASPEARAFFSRHRIAVGSTGNLGLSIGIMSAQLGFRVTVHMSSDARQWKKDKLRAHGVEVVEHASDYSAAVAVGRRQAAEDPACHFVDDENSTALFLGYAVAALRLKDQLAAAGIRVDAAHPLFVYLPCGVGGGPGGVAFGLKHVFGDAVHCVFAEPVNSPCMLLGVRTGLHDAVSVADFGLDNRTAADGLAVGRASGFVGKAMQRLIAGYCTVSDDELFALLALLEESEGLRLEPSALAGMPGMLRVLDDAAADYRQRIRLDAAASEAATHLVWATGGSMVPEAEMQTFLTRGRALIPA